MELPLPSVSILQDVVEISHEIQSADAGVLLVTDLDRPDFSQVQRMFDHLSSTPEGQKITKDLNQAYTKNLVYKDSFASGHGGPSVDMKRVLDLSPERLAVITKINPDLSKLTQDLKTTLTFWENLRTKHAEKILQAVAQATGSDDVTKDVAYNYRMVDYYQRPRNEYTDAPRCSEHRDFGTFTLVTTTGPGLQVFHHGKWCDVASDQTVLLFGWCTQIRSNGRIPACLHRVEEAIDERRTSMVLFCAPKLAATPLEPAVGPGELPQYIGGLKVGQLRGKMARKWRHREGTLSEEDKVLEEEEIRLTNLKTQDDVVQSSITLQNKADSHAGSVQKIPNLIST